jgi:hypothetical protein
MYRLEKEFSIHRLFKSPEYDFLMWQLDVEESGRERELSDFAAIMPK